MFNYRSLKDLIEGDETIIKNRMDASLPLPPKPMAIEEKTEEYKIQTSPKI
jgi:hypothetical protein